MSRSPTLRYEIAQAPPGLRLLQDLLNTVGVEIAGQVDLLDNAQNIAPWLESIDASFADRQLRKSDLAKLRALRDYLRRTISAGAVSGTTSAFPSGSILLAVGSAKGEVSVVPMGHGIEKIVSALLAERLFAERSGTWRRLKLCQNTACSLAFYDRTRNNNGVWHDVHICGNAINLRASRQRRKLDKKAVKVKTSALHLRPYRLLAHVRAIFATVSLLLLATPSVLAAASGCDNGTDRDTLMPVRQVSAMTTRSPDLKESLMWAVFRIKLSAHGEIRSVRIAYDSGNKLFDQAALQSVVSTVFTSVDAHARDTTFDYLLFQREGKRYAQLLTHAPGSDTSIAANVKIATVGNPWLAVRK